MNHSIHFWLPTKAARWITFVFSETKLEVLFGGLEITIKLETRQLQHQVDFFSSSQTFAERIEELLVFITSHLAAEMHSEAARS